MHRRTETTAAEQLAASYRRLRRLNDVVDPARLATDPQLLAAMHEWTAPLDGALTVLAGIHYNLFLGTLHDHDPLEERPLDEFHRMDRIGTFLCTELAHGNNAHALETVADYDHDNGTFTLHTPHLGAQKFMPNTSLAGGPKSAVVAARLRVDDRDRGVLLFLVPLTDEIGTLPGVTVRSLPLRPGSPIDHCLTSFDRVVLPRESLLTGVHGRLSGDGTLTSAYSSKRKQFLAAIGRVTVGKLCMTASALGGARAALATAVRYAHHRKISGARPDDFIPLWGHRTHHGPLLKSLATVYAMTALHRATVARWVDRDPTDSEAVAAAERQTAITKGWSTWQARNVIVESRERCGAQGMMPPNGIISMLSDVEGTITAEGDNLALWCKAAAELLLGAETPAPAIRDDETTGRDLVDPVVRQALLAEAAHLHLARARERAREIPDGDRLQRWNAAAPDALVAVTARAEHDAAAALLGWAAAADDAARPVLLDLHQLFTVERIDNHSSLLLGAQKLTVGQADMLSAMQESSIRRLAEYGIPLVDAFDLPEEFFAGRPISNPTYQQAFTADVVGWDPTPSSSELLAPV
ncbi:acyl-CoA dehydrogenase family protein [Nocardia sp. NBC_01329]|uniref:acyl-CoA dehydrogenase family protein n=1 Tax=Nocardia sp. NBC_01329 TaxID=2903594 RepID=UPI002E143661|nr:acyl-CoA dehydrogenase family protein [Nocardia sp. NBC_01329]